MARVANISLPGLIFYRSFKEKYYETYNRVIGKCGHICNCPGFVAVAQGVLQTLSLMKGDGHETEAPSAVGYRTSKVVSCYSPHDRHATENPHELQADHAGFYSVMVVGWGTWIRTRATGVRVRGSTAKLFPIRRARAFCRPRGAYMIQRRFKVKVRTKGADRCSVGGRRRSAWRES